MKKLRGGDWAISVRTKPRLGRVEREFRIWSLRAVFFGFFLSFFLSFYLPFYLPFLSIFLPFLSIFLSSFSFFLYSFPFFHSFHFFLSFYLSFLSFIGSMHPRSRSFHSGGFESPFFPSFFVPLIDNTADVPPPQRRRALSSACRLPGSRSNGGMMAEKGQRM